MFSPSQHSQSCSHRIIELYSVAFEVAPSEQHNSNVINELRIWGWTVIEERPAFKVVMSFWCCWPASSATETKKEQSPEKDPKSSPCSASFPLRTSGGRRINGNWKSRWPPSSFGRSMQGIIPTVQCHFRLNVQTRPIYPDLIHLGSCSQVLVLWKQE